MSELIIERVIIDRSQTQLKEFFNSQVDPVVVCSLNTTNITMLSESSSNLLEPDEIVVCNHAARKMLALSSDDTKLSIKEMAGAATPLFQTKRLVQQGD